MGWFFKLWRCVAWVVVGTKDLPICIALSPKANAPVILADIIYIDVHRLGVTSTYIVKWVGAHLRTAALSSTYMYS